MAETTLEITQITHTLDVTGGEATTLEIVEPVEVNILEIAAQGVSGTPGANGITGIAEDASPTLGGDLTLNGFGIIGQLENNSLLLDGGLVEG